MVSNTERYHKFLNNLPARAKQMPSKILFVGEKTWQPFGYLRPKIVIVGSNIHELQIIIPVLNNLTVLEYTKNIFTSVSLAQGVGYLPRREPPL